MVVAPALIAASTQRRRKSRSVRVASSADHSTSPHRLRARVTELVTSSITSCGCLFSFHFMCTGLVDRKVCMRPRLAGRTASPHRSMSLAPARARPHTVLSVTISEMRRTASKSPLEAMGKPASMMSTLISSRILASSSFSSRDMEAPGDCSPSRMVVSKMITRSDWDADLPSCRGPSDCTDMGFSLRGNGRRSVFQRPPARRAASDTRLGRPGAAKPQSQAQGEVPGGNSRGESRTHGGLCSEKARTGQADAGNL